MASNSTDLLNIPIQSDLSSIWKVWKCVTWRYDHFSLRAGTEPARRLTDFGKFAFAAYRKISCYDKFRPCHECNPMIFSHKNQHTWLIILSKMAANISSFLNKIASLGLGVAVVGGVVNTALYNGEWYTTVRLILKIWILIWSVEFTTSKFQHTCIPFICVFYELLFVILNTTMAYSLYYWDISSKHHLLHVYTYYGANTECNVLYMHKVIASYLCELWTCFVLPNTIWDEVTINLLAV